MRRLLLLTFLVFLALLVAHRCLAAPSGCRACEVCGSAGYPCSSSSSCCSCVCGSGCGAVPSDYREWSCGVGWCRLGRKCYGGDYVVAYVACSASDEDGWGDEGKKFFSGRSWSKAIRVNSSVLHRVYWTFVDHVDWRGSSGSYYAEARSSISAYGRVEGFWTVWFGVDDEKSITTSTPNRDVYKHSHVKALWDCVDAKRSRLKLGVSVDEGYPAYRVTWRACGS